jgi:hypothetical protein
MDQVYITSLLDDFKNHSFLLFRVAKNFCSDTSFKESIFSLSPILEDGAQTAMDFERLFAVEGKLGSDIQNKIDFLKSCAQISWPNVPSKNDKMFEDEVMVDLAKKVLLPLFEHVEFEPKYKDLVKGIPGLKVGNIGLGSVHTFHGMPDLRLPGLYILATTETMSVEGVEEEGEEPSLSSGYGSESKVQLCDTVFSWGFIVYFCLVGTGMSSSATSITGGS